MGERLVVIALLLHAGLGGTGVPNHLPFPRKSKPIQVMGGVSGELRFIRYCRIARLRPVVSLRRTKRASRVGLFGTSEPGAGNLHNQAIENLTNRGAHQPCSSSDA